MYVETLNQFGLKQVPGIGLSIQLPSPKQTVSVSQPSCSSSVQDSVLKTKSVRTVNLNIGSNLIVLYFYLNPPPVVPKLSDIFNIILKEM